ncbi:insulinase family protein [Ectothiorhodospiraceae bacterium 2226]|nr:insulinase family protein [Ectothiorhodospiraceae bacterium 2226]
MQSWKTWGRAWLAAVLTVTGGAAMAQGPAIEHWETENGARVLFVAAPELPMVDVRVVFDAGSARDGDRPGLALMTNAMLREGAGEWDVDEIGNRFESVGAQVGTSALRDMAVASLRSLTEPALLAPALETFAAVLREPTFPEPALERERSRTVTALRAREQDPGPIAQRNFYEALYGSHPYGHQSLGTPASVQQLTREVLQAFHARYYVGRNATVAIVGALDRAEAEAVAEHVVGGLPSGEPAPALPAPPRASDGQERRVNFPSSQTHILVGHTAIERGDPDFFPLMVGNHILGGSGFGSRVVREIREERGLAYSAYSGFRSMRVAGPFVMGLQTRNREADQALGVLRATLEKFVEQGPTAQELRAAKLSITGGFPLRLDSNSKIVEQLAAIGFYDMPLDWLARYNERVEAVTLEDVRDAFRRRVLPEALTVVLVGGGAADTAADAR